MSIDIFSLFILFYTNLNLTVLQQKTNADTLFKTGKYADTHVAPYIYMECRAKNFSNLLHTAKLHF